MRLDVNVLGNSPPPGSELRIGDGVRLIGVTQGSLQIAMAEPLADGGKANASVDELRRMGMAQLMEGGVDASGGTVPDPVLVGRLIAQRTTPAVLLSAEQGPPRRVVGLEWQKRSPQPGRH